MKNLLLFISIVILSTTLFADEIVWTEQSASLPDGVKLFKGTRNNPKLQAFYLDVDLNVQDIAIRPYITSSPKTVPIFTSNVGAYAAINGGFLAGATSVSTIIYPVGQIKAQNVQTVGREHVTGTEDPYPVIRSLFSMDTSGSMSVDWIYHFSGAIDDMYKFDAPLPYTLNDKETQPAPIRSDGVPMEGVMLGIGGVPTLVKDGQVHNTYNEEILWGAAGNSNGDPRTAVGYTSDGHAILFVADGRTTISDGVGLSEMAQILIDLGCVEAMNLDGGGSTQMAIGNNYVNTPPEYRSVATILAVVDKDSLNLPRRAQIEKIIDTEDDACQFIGSGWFETANEGYWGSSRSMLHGKGDGSAYAEYRLSVPTPAKYTIFAWWVAAFNRCTDTPFIIHHAHGADTVKKDQTAEGSSWVEIGEYYFTGDSSEVLRITDGATGGSYVVADGIKLVAYDTTETAITRKYQPVIKSFDLKQNYPNPFNPKTTIRYDVETFPPNAGQVHATSVHINLSIYNLLGQKVATLVSGSQPSGNYHIEWDASSPVSLPGGVYFYRLRTEQGSQTKKMIYMP